MYRAIGYGFTGLVFYFGGVWGLAALVLVVILMLWKADQIGEAIDRWADRVAARRFRRRHHQLLDKLEQEKRREEGP